MSKKYVNYTIKMPPEMKQAWRKRLKGENRSALIRAFVNKFIEEYNDLGSTGTYQILNGNFSLDKGVEK